MTTDPSRIAAHLTPNECSVLRALPAYDRGDLPEEIWWAFHSLLDEGLAASDGRYLISTTSLGRAVLQALGDT